MKNHTYWRTLALALLVVNLLFWAWSEGYLRALGLGPHRVNEPERLQEQVKPEALKMQAIGGG